jgi:hypothetical protein
VSRCSEYKEGCGCGDEGRWTGGRALGSKRLIEKQQKVGKEMSSEVKKRTKGGRMRCKNERYRKNIRKEKGKEKEMETEKEKEKKEMTMKRK